MEVRRSYIDCHRKLYFPYDFKFKETSDTVDGYTGTYVEGFTPTMWVGGLPENLNTKTHDNERDEINGKFVRCSLNYSLCLRTCL